MRMIAFPTSPTSLFIKVKLLANINYLKMGTTSHIILYIEYKVYDSYNNRHTS